MLQDNGENARIKIAFKFISSQLGLDIPSAPVEEMGYINIIIKPDCPNTQDSQVIIKNRQEVNHFFSPIRALFCIHNGQQKRFFLGDRNIPGRPQAYPQEK
jgi:hypothetical protein